MEYTYLAADIAIYQQFVGEQNFNVVALSQSNGLAMFNVQTIKTC